MHLVVAFLLAVVSNVHGQIFRVDTASKLSSFAGVTIPSTSTNKIVTSKLPFTPIGLEFKGGPVLSQGANIYAIWYGSWSTGQKSVIRNFINSLGSKNADIPGSVRRWWKVNGVYYNSSGNYLSTAVSLLGEATDGYSLGRKLSSIVDNQVFNDIASIVVSKIDENVFPLDPNGIYLVLTSADVTVTGFCTSFCGYHWLFNDNFGDNYQFAFIGNAETQCADNCQSGGIIDGARGMISVIAHELTETLTDPSLSAWLNSQTNDENADSCTYTYGKWATNSDGSIYNLVGASNFKYLVQQNVNPKIGKCVLQEPYTSPPQLPIPYTPVGILYQGGAVLDKGVNVYLVWIGSWSANQKGIIRNFIQSMGAEEAGVTNSVRNWWQITSLYYNAKGQYLSSNLSLKGEYIQSAASSITFSDISVFFGKILATGKLPKDPKGAYIVLTGSNVIVSRPTSGVSGCSKCFNHGLVNGTRWRWVGNGAKLCPGACGTANTTNGDAGVDSMITHIAVQISRTVTDPLLGFAWNIPGVGQSVDFCTGNFGKLSGAYSKMYNLVGLSGKKYLVQQNWNPKTGRCVSSA